MREDETYQLDATMGLLRTLILFDFGFRLTFGIEDLFFFFCNSRPIVGKGQNCDAALERVEFYQKGKFYTGVGAL